MYAFIITPIANNYNRITIIVFDEDGRLYCTLQVYLESRNSVKKLNIKWKNEHIIDFHKKLSNQKYETGYCGDTMYIIEDQQNKYEFISTTGFKWSKPTTNPINLENPIIDKFKLNEITDIINLSLSDKLSVCLLKIIAGYVIRNELNFMTYEKAWEIPMTGYNLTKRKYFGFRINLLGLRYLM
jgi:hypothetical protein